MRFTVSLPFEQAINNGILCSVIGWVCLFIYYACVFYVFAIQKVCLFSRTVCCDCDLNRVGVGSLL